MDRGRRPSAGRSDRASSGESERRTASPASLGEGRSTASRREALGALGGALAVATTGCTSSLPGFGWEPPTFGTWLPADPLTSDATPTVTVEHLGGLRSALPLAHPRMREFDGLARQYGFGLHQLDARISIDSETSFATVIAGGFDREAALQAMDVDANRVDRIDDFVVLTQSQAAGPGSLVLSSRPERYVEARLGRRERVYEVDETWRAAIEDVAEADALRIEAHGGRPYDLLAVAVEAQPGPSFEGTAYAHYESPEAAASYSDGLPQHVADLVDEGVDTAFRDQTLEENVVKLLVGFDEMPF